MTSDAGPPGAPRFNVVLRGYDRRQVDEHVARLQRVIARMRADLSARNQYGEVTGYRPPPRGPLQPGRPGPMPGPGGPVPPGEPPDAIGGFTDRMQRILQSAEDEAEDIRNRARAAARAESEQMRAQLDELARQRDLMMRELTALRGQLPESERTDRMPHPGIGGPGQEPSRSGIPSPRPHPSGPADPGGPDARAGSAPAGPGAPDSRMAPAAGSGRPDPRVAPAGAGPGPESHTGPAGAGPTGPDPRTAQASAGPGGPDPWTTQARARPDSRNSPAPPVAAPPGASRAPRFDRPAAPPLWDNAGARSGVTPVDGAPEAAPPASRPDPATPPDPATAASPLVRTPDASSNPGRPSSPAKPPGRSEPGAAQAPTDRPGTDDRTGAGPAGTPDQLARGQAGPAEPAPEARPGEETMLLERPAAPTAGSSDQATGTDTERTGTPSTSSSR